MYIRQKVKGRMNKTRVFVKNYNQTDRRFLLYKYIFVKTATRAIAEKIGQGLNDYKW